MSIEDKIKENTSLVYYVIKDMCPALIGDEDIQQSGMIGLWKACRDYDESLGYQFSTYAYRLISTEIQNELRKRIQASKLSTSSIDSEDNKLVYVLSSPDEYSKVHLLDMISGLSEYHKKIVSLRIYGYSQREIAKIMKKSRTQICNDLKAIRKLLS